VQRRLRLQAPARASAPAHAPRLALGVRDAGRLDVERDFTLPILSRTRKTAAAHDA
jgi:hypothetical protein